MVGNLPLHLFGWASVAYAAASILWSTGDRVVAGIWLLVLVCTFLLGARLASIRGVWLCFCLLCTWNLVAALIEFYGMDFEGYGLAGNPNYFGCALALGVAAAIGYHFWWFLPIGLGGLAWVQSRGAIFAASVACFAGLWYRYRVTGFVVLAACIIAITQIRPETYGPFHRLGIWQDTLNHLTFWGTGFGSFSAEYARFAVKTNAAFTLAGHAYNDILELIFSLGIGSVFVWGLIAVCFEGRDWPDRLICLTFGALSLTYFPLWVVGPLFTLTLGHLSQTKEHNPWLVGNLRPRTIS